eukprot:CAMPEP_0173384404 /NCGR_PEP_ID=MMETSP1356-20130122/6987_1 /TAXON_ID=77927 ORGANISM="Hemiselmis virescens, Strain PCC157" /NCGR_SAMPLE_ID=MMETSP1356 /ASSEMBLY_ACC=CAM_ASM_000847 /LENGTH=44 /DNA_ID= /DNA_START= /DNA_END= /DNA_ORIENTATION=
MKEFPASPEGMIASYVERFSEEGPLKGLVDQVAKCGQFPYGSHA